MPAWMTSGSGGGTGGGAPALAGVNGNLVGAALDAGSGVLAGRISYGTGGIAPGGGATLFQLVYGTTLSRAPMGVQLSGGSVGGTAFWYSEWQVTASGLWILLGPGQLVASQAAGSYFVYYQLVL